MSIKFKKNELPLNHSVEDFQCFLPIATKDGQFQDTMMADLGSFSQEGKDSNKYYTAHITQSKQNSNWYCYFEWGRTNSGKPNFQFYECCSLDEAKELYKDQLLSKNVKRGVWKNHPVLGKILEPKPGKDLYLVRPQSVRSTGLPDAKRLIEKPISAPIISSSSLRLDRETLDLLRDLNSGALAYTRSQVQSNSIPTQSTIEEARIICDEATKLTNLLPQTDWLANKELLELSSIIYRRIPKHKSKNSNWILDPEQVLLWRADLDAFESALHSNTHEIGDPLGDLNLVKLKYVPQAEPQGGWVYKWWPNATRNVHGNVGTLRIKNVWYLERIGDVAKLENYQKSIVNEVNKFDKKPLHQPTRSDPHDENLYRKTNTFSLFHGTRSVNVPGILRESLRLPKTLSGTKITGAMFGSLLYFSDDIKKSVGYTSYNNSYWSKGDGKINNRGAFMFVADVICGNMYFPKSVQSFTDAPKGYHSIFAEMKTAGLMNNEIIIPKTEAVRLRYLIEFE